MSEVHDDDGRGHHGRDDDDDHHLPDVRGHVVQALTNICAMVCFPTQNAFTQLFPVKFDPFCLFTGYFFFLSNVTNYFLISISIHYSYRKKRVKMAFTSHFHPF